jgi:hypothetical protein
MSANYGSGIQKNRPEFKKTDRNTKKQNRSRKLSKWVSENIRSKGGDNSICWMVLVGSGGHGAGNNKIKLKGRRSQ